MPSEEDDDASDVSTIELTTHAQSRMKERRLLLADVLRVKKYGSVTIQVEVRLGAEEIGMASVLEWIGKIKSQFPGTESLPPVKVEGAKIPRIELRILGAAYPALDMKHFLEAEGFFSKCMGNRIAFSLAEAGTAGTYAETVVVEGGRNLKARPQVITVIRKMRTGPDVEVQEGDVEMLNNELLVILDRFDSISECNRWEDVSRFIPPSYCPVFCISRH